MRFLFGLFIYLVPAFGVAGHSHEDWKPRSYSPAEAYAPSPLPERIVLTWTGDPATTQAVTWRTDTFIRRGVAEIAVANNHGRALLPDQVFANTTPFTSDLNKAHYHTVEFTGLKPERTQIFNKNL